MADLHRLAARWRTAKLPEEVSLETALTFRSVSFKEAVESSGRDFGRELSSTKLKISSHMFLALRRGAPELTDTTNAMTEAASTVRTMDGQEVDLAVDWAAADSRASRAELSVSNESLESPVSNLVEPKKRRWLPQQTH